MFVCTVARWGLSQALRYADMIEAACADSPDPPPQAQSCSNIRRGYRRRGVERHVIYFRQTIYGIAIIRILHDRMDARQHL
ncbi:type II toxin-antitoxin system RelE/ParE family toxin [uncultured Sphingomonas sp.]|uniref:type II toxin-antitoxin system RelE/ParE family toxin n=1 Tax=uncultured Sphingomonas sp. TaxID=158754 RepID=UPI0035CC7B04